MYILVQCGKMHHIGDACWEQHGHITPNGTEEDGKVQPMPQSPGSGKGWSVSRMLRGWDTKSPQRSISSVGYLERHLFALRRRLQRLQLRPGTPPALALPRRDLCLPMQADTHAALLCTLNYMACLRRHVLP